MDKHNWKREICIGAYGRNDFRVLIQEHGKPNRIVNYTRRQFKASDVQNKAIFGKSLAKPAPSLHESPFGTLITYRNMVKFKIHGVQPDHLRFTSRGVVSLDFGGKARKRLLDKMNQWRLPGRNMIFAHVTYPAEYPLDWRVWKLDLKRLKQMLMRKFPAVQGIWKLELQRRGAPHYHLILDLGENCSIKRFRQWLDAAWARIAHQNDQYGGRYACRAEIIFSVRHAMNYGAKYLNKPNHAPVDDDGVIMTSEDLNGATIGRHWGVIGKLDCRPTSYTVRYLEHVPFLRLKYAQELQMIGAKKWLYLLTRNPYYTFTVYGVGDSRDGNQPPNMALIRDWFEDEKLFTDEYQNLINDLTQTVNPASQNGTWKVKPI